MKENKDVPAVEEEKGSWRAYIQVGMKRGEFKAKWDAVMIMEKRPLQPR